MPETQEAATIEARAEQIAPSLFRIALPLPGSGLSSVNAYAVVAGDGLTLIDCGWGSSKTYDALVAGLHEAGTGLSSLKTLVVTHTHPDHVGLAKRLVEETGAKLLVHKKDARYLGATEETLRGVTARTDRWLARCGIPAADLEEMTGVGQWLVAFSTYPTADIVLEGGEVLRYGSYDFEVMHTPGHDDGMVCLYDRASGVFISADHVLEHISPHTGMHAEEQGDPVGAYLDALRLVADLPATVIAPGHGAPFHGLASRAADLIQHHQERCDEIVDALDADSLSALEAAAKLSWRHAHDGWTKLNTFDRRLAVTETAAHLVYLMNQARLSRGFDEAAGVYRYMRIPT